MLALGTGLCPPDLYRASYEYEPSILDLLDAKKI